MTKEECMAMIKFYQDILYKIILGIGAANVTLIGFAFDKKMREFQVLCKLKN